MNNEYGNFLDDANNPAMNTITSATTIPGLVWAYRLRPGANKPERLSDDTDRTTLFTEDGFL